MHCGGNAGNDGLLLACESNRLIDLKTALKDIGKDISKEYSSHRYTRLHLLSIIIHVAQQASAEYSPKHFQSMSTVELPPSHVPRFYVAADQHHTHICCCCYCTDRSVFGCVHQ